MIVASDLGFALGATAQGRYGSWAQVQAVGR